MSDVEQELTPETDEELAEQAEPEPDGIEPEPDEEPEGDDEPEAVAEPEPQGLTEKEIQQRFDKLGKENERHANRVGEILAEDANDLVPCPLCSHFIHGLIYPQVPPEEIVNAVLPAIGMAGVNDYQEAKWASRCPDCDGHGLVITGSRIHENVAVKCITCNGSGYTVTSGAVPAPQGPVGESQAGDAPLYDGVNPDDPAVAELRARGFMVMPLPKIGETAAS
jgi:rubrerythrin